MPKKPTSLLDEIKTLPNRRHGRKGDWYDRLVVSHPEAAEDIDRIVKLWKKNDRLIRSKFPDQVHLAEFCVAKHGHHKGTETSSGAVGVLDPID